MIPQAMNYVSGRQTEMLQRILIVDDEPDINMIAKISLESFGKYDVETCSSGVEALEILKWYEPNLILLDVMMPFMDGEETIRRIKRNPKTAHIPVIFVTAKIFKKDLAKYKDLGALDVVPKPFDPIRLPKQVYDIWAGYYSKREAEHEIEEKVRELQVSFVEGMSARLSVLREEWAEFQNSEQPDTLMAVYNTIHKITGVSGTLNLEEIYRTALIIEQTIAEAIDKDESQLDAAAKKQISEHITVLGLHP